MNETQIRENFYRQKLYKHYAAPNTLIVNELGLKHGKCRADIAVINNHLTGYEIKSDEDTLRRLDKQVETYTTVFDRATVIVGTKHAKIVNSYIPSWWGIIATYKGSRDGVHFETIRPSSLNKEIDLLSIAQLLWSDEVAHLLMELGVPQKALRKKRSFLYQQLIELVSPSELRCRVRECLKKRRNWRCPELPFLGGGSFQPSAK